MKNYKIKSYCKINLFLRITKKLNSGYHSIASLITFCEPHDIISISLIKKTQDRISFSGKFKKGISSKSNVVTKILTLLRNRKLLGRQKFEINIKKNIPHGSGLGGGSSNAANLLNFFNSKMNLKLSKNKKKILARKIGFDVPISLEKRNAFLSGKKERIFRFDQKLKFNLLIVYPNLICSTSKVYRKNKRISSLKSSAFLHIRDRKKMIDFLKKEKNDLETAAIKIHPRIKRIINDIKSQKGCHFSRITGSGSACIGIFSNMNKAITAKKMIKLKYPKYWCAVSKTI